VKAVRVGVLRSRRKTTGLRAGHYNGTEQRDKPAATGSR